MVDVVKYVATPMAHMNAVVMVGMNFLEMLGNAQVLKGQSTDYLSNAIEILISDIDECTTGTHNCSGLAECVNEIGFFYCNCSEGYRLDDSQTSCTGIVSVDSYTTILDACMEAITVAKLLQMSMNVLRVLLDVVRSVLTQLEALFARVWKAMSCFLMERIAQVCGCRSTKNSMKNWQSQMTVCNYTDHVETIT